MNKNSILRDEESYLIDEYGEVIEKGNIKINRSHEFSCAGSEYTCSFLEYVCTHEKGYIDTGDENYYKINIEWDLFKKFALGGLTKQTERLTKEIYRLMTNQRPVLIPRRGGGYKLMQPFNIVIETADKTQIADGTRKKLENIGHEKIGNMTIYFSKDLFQEFVEGGNQWFQMPTALYAKLYDQAKVDEKCSQLTDGELDKLSKEYNLSAEQYLQAKANLLQIREIDRSTSSKTRRDDFQFIFGYEKLVYYLCLHNNLNRHTNDYIDVDKIELVRSVCPQYLTLSKKKEYVREKEAVRFLDAALNILSKISGFDFTILSTNFINNKIRFHIKRNYNPGK
jgi:hypothetical protein